MKIDKCCTLLHILLFIFLPLSYIRILNAVKYLITVSIINPLFMSSITQLHPYIFRLDILCSNKYQVMNMILFSTYNIYFSDVMIFIFLWKSYRFFLFYNMFQDFKYRSCMKYSCNLYYVISVNYVRVLLLTRICHESEIGKVVGRWWKPKKLFTFQRLISVEAIT